MTIKKTKHIQKFKKKKKKKDKGVEGPTSQFESLLFSGIICPYILWRDNTAILTHNQKRPKKGIKLSSLFQQV